MNKSVLWKQVQMILDNLSVLINRVASIAKKPTGKHQMLVTDENGESKWIERTHYDDAKEEFYFKDFAAVPDDGDELFSYVGEFKIIVGKKYHVVFDGVPYDIVGGASQFDEHYIGNAHIFDPNYSPDTGEPFCLLNNRESSELWIMTSEALNGRLFSLSDRTQELKKLDSKYLPDDIGGSADWNASEGEAGYVKNRTHSKTWANEVIMPETEAAEVAGERVAFVGDAINVVDGVEYTVVWCGTEYKCTATAMAEGGMIAHILGNGAPVGLPDTGEPFVLVIFPKEVVESNGGMNVQGMYDGAEGPVTLAIKREGWQYNRLPFEYLPKGYPGVTMMTGEIFPETRLHVNNPAEFYTENQLLAKLIPEKTYTVNWNGVDHNVVAKQVYDEKTKFSFVALGNTEKFMYGTTTDDPFCIFDPKGTYYQYSASKANVYALAYDNSQIVTIKITGEYEGVIEMDARFIKSALSNYVRITEEPGAEPELLSLPVRYTTDGENFFWTPMSLKHVMAWNFGDYMHDGAIIYCKNSEDWIATGSTFVTVNNNAVDGIVLDSSTPGSQKRFRITVDDSGKISAAEYTAG